MLIVVLGSAAAGGFPQWNSNCPTRSRLSGGDRNTRQRTQSSLAVSEDGRQWFILNASPDLRQQIRAAPFLQPRPGHRENPIAGVVLSNADIDQIAGLLNLRVNHTFVLHAPGRVLRVLEANPIFNVLDRDKVLRRPLPLDRAVPLTTPEGPTGIFVTLFGVRSAEQPTVPGAGETVGIQVSHHGRSFFYIPECAGIDDALSDRLEGADLLFFDGTIWRDAEVGQTSPARGKGHMCIDGEHGSLRRLADRRLARRVFIHIDSTNPILAEDSPERRRIVEAGWEIAFDGMRMVL